MNDKNIILGIRESGCGNLMCKNCMVEKNRDISEEDQIVVESDKELWCDYCDNALK